MYIGPYFEIKVKKEMREQTESVMCGNGHNRAFNSAGSYCDQCGSKFECIVRVGKVYPSYLDDICDMDGLSDITPDGMKATGIILAKTCHASYFWPGHAYSKSLPTDNEVESMLENLKSYKDLIRDIEDCPLVSGVTCKVGIVNCWS